MMVVNTMTPTELKVQEQLSLTTGVCVRLCLFVCVCVYAGEPAKRYI